MDAANWSTLWSKNKLFKNDMEYLVLSTAPTCREFSTIAILNLEPVFTKVFDADQAFDHNNKIWMTYDPKLQCRGYAPDKFGSGNGG